MPIGDIVVTASREKERRVEIPMSIGVIGGEELRSVPGSMGDVMRGLQSLPGVVLVGNPAAEQLARVAAVVR